MRVGDEGEEGRGIIIEAGELCPEGWATIDTLTTLSKEEGYTSATQPENMLYRRNFGSSLGQ
jgi:hypothetical protein